MIHVCPIGMLLSGINRKVRKLTLLSGIVAVTFGGGGGGGGRYCREASTCSVALLSQLYGIEISFTVPNFT